MIGIWEGGSPNNQYPVHSMYWGICGKKEGTNHKLISRNDWTTKLNSASQFYQRAGYMSIIYMNFF